MAKKSHKYQFPNRKSKEKPRNENNKAQLNVPYSLHTNNTLSVENALSHRTLGAGEEYDVVFKKHHSIDFKEQKFNNYVKSNSRRNPENVDIYKLIEDITPCKCKLDELGFEIGYLDDSNKTTNEKRSRFIKIFKDGYNCCYDETKLIKCKISNTKSKLRFVLLVEKEKKKAEIMLLDPNHLLATEIYDDYEQCSSDNKFDLYNL